MSAQKVAVIDYHKVNAAIHYNLQKIYIRAVLTHSEYDKGTWKE